MFYLTPCRRPGFPPEGELDFVFSPIQWFCVDTCRFNSQIIHWDREQSRSLNVWKYQCSWCSFPSYHRKTRSLPLWRKMNSFWWLSESMYKSAVAHYAASVQRYTPLVWYYLSFCATSELRAWWPTFQPVLKSGFHVFCRLMSWIEWY
jgi:hypothetical protein